MAKNQKNQGQQAIEALLSKPVGRRWVLKVGAGLAIAGSLGSLAACGGSSDDHPSEEPDQPETVPRTLHLALSPNTAYSNLQLVINGQSYPLLLHTSATRGLLIETRGVWGKLNINRLTHQVNAPFPTARVQLATVYGTLNGQRVVVAQCFLVPESATRALAQASFQLTGNYKAVAGSAQRLAFLGLDGAQVSSLEEVFQLEQVLDTYQVAVTLTMLHPNVATRAPLEAAATKSLLHQTPEVSTLGSYIGQMQQSGKPFAHLTQAVDAKGQSSQITIKGKDKTITTGFSTIQLNQTDATFTQTARSAFVAGIRGVRDTASLGTVINKPLDEIPGNTSTWHQPEGMAITPIPYSSALNASAGVDIKIQNEGLLFGTYTAANGPVSGSTVPLKLYNNYVRWVSVYVQYLKADGTNLSASATPSGMNTQHAQFVGLLPQVFTVLGVPLWDTNTLNISLNFPAEAISARLLFCGLGSELVGGGWRQYFPASAYANNIAPTDEVLLAGLLTGIVTLGINGFALAADIDIAATWASVREAIQSFSGDFTTLQLDLREILSLGAMLSEAEALAAGVAAGGATYEDVSSDRADLSNLWSILVALGTVIPKVIFNPQILGEGRIWAAIDQAFFEQMAAEKIADSIPLLGEIFAIATAVGDAATLAQAIGETVASPWVFANQITRTYPATVTVSRDPHAATWPVTARSWQIQTKIDDTVAAAPITGQFNANGTESAPIVLNLSAPFGGKTITWSIVLLDANGHQVGTGVSAQLNNTDSNNPPSNVAFAITELPAAITASTVFKRAATTVYSSAAGGYTWASPSNNSGTHLNAGIQEVAGVTVATRLGVAGLVFKQNNKYWLRGVPLVENGNTITLGSATRQGYARRPFLLFDALVGDADVGNHVLLEPDDTSDGYHVRRLNINATNGALSWDPSVSLGFFSLPVSAAALHTSGHVVAVHTDSGRLGRIFPVNTGRPPLAAYTAGPGTQIGLLSSPTAVAVTPAGIVIVLEAGAAQLAAFDLNGNPVRQFGSSTPKNFTLPLLKSRVYLDLAVDGSGDIYVLSYQNNGDNTDQYRIDVYGPTGEAVSTLSTDNNVPHLAVDYWRSIYAANYTSLQDTNGQVRIDPVLGVAEPSLSRFDPS